MKKWLPAVLERVDPSQLPKYYGGDLTDADGNPKCLEKFHKIRIKCLIIFNHSIINFRLNGVAKFQRKCIQQKKIASTTTQLTKKLL